MTSKADSLPELPRWALLMLEDGGETAAKYIQLVRDYGQQCYEAGVAAERERCAKLCETPGYARALIPGTNLEIGKELAVYIRHRKAENPRAFRGPGE